MNSNWRIIVILGLALAAVIGIVSWLSQPPVVPSNAAKLEISGTGKVVLNVKGADVYETTDKVRRVSNQTIDLDGSRTFQFVGEVNVQSKDGKVAIKVNDKTTIEPPSRQSVFAVSVSHEGTVKIGAAVMGYYRVDNCKRLMVNLKANVTANGCETVEVFGDSEVVVNDSKSVAANTFAKVIAKNVESVTASDNSFVECHGCKSVVVRGKSKADVTGADSVVAQDQSKVKVSDCKKVDIKDAAEKVRFFIWK